jgi:hypothetical protein
LSPWIIKIYSQKEIKRLNTIENPYKIYVTLGFHVSMRHSWRGDTNDEAGFGTDIRVVRKIIKICEILNYSKFFNVWVFGVNLPAQAGDSIWLVSDELKKEFKGINPDVFLFIDGQNFVGINVKNTMRAKIMLMKH